MQLILSSGRSVRNTIFTHESGQVLYKTTHPLSSEVAGGMGTTTIYKVMPNDDPTDMRDQLGVIGEIEWHQIGSSTFRLNGQEMQSDTFLPSHGILGRKRTFTGPDGSPYRWDMVFGPFGTVVVLSRDDGSRTEVARYHRGSGGIVGPKGKPRLVVDPDVEHMLDLIVLTFVYVEKIRMDKDIAVFGLLATQAR
ncbi:hypothetical protein HD554DRAFT_2040864 [Boletus coccyginus]|nr:hypothetical protein HD554DRAFT_2040864 [Boletus coccyginus]